MIKPDRFKWPRNFDSNHSAFSQLLTKCAIMVAIDRNDWRPVVTAPFDRLLELAVIDREGAHALVFPCRRVLGGWLSAESSHRVDVNPTHWREWKPPVATSQ